MNGASADSRANAWHLALGNSVTFCHRSPIMDFQVIGLGTPFSSLQQVFEAQQKDRPSHRAMALKVVGFSPARVPKLNEGLLLNRRQIEGDFSFLPFVVTLPFRGFPGDTFF